MTLDWQDAQLFALVAETGSFTAAAKRLGIRQSTVSRRIVELEEKVRGQLFERGREGATPTRLGARLIPAARAMAQAGAELELLAFSEEQALAGKVRITAIPGLASDIVVPFAATVRETHPEIKIEVLSDLEILDLSRGHADLAIRTRPAVEHTEVSLGSASAELVIYASPEYVATLPKCPKLEDLEFIGWSSALEHLPPMPQLRAALPNFAPLFTSNSFLIQLRALECGLGVMILPRGVHLVGARQNLVEIPLGLPLGAGSVHIVCAKHAAWVPRIRRVGEALVSYIDSLTQGI